MSENDNISESEDLEGWDLCDSDSDADGESESVESVGEDVPTVVSDKDSKEENDEYKLTESEEEFIVEDIECLQFDERGLLLFLQQLDQCVAEVQEVVLHYVDTLLGAVGLDRLRDWAFGQRQDHDH